MSTKNPIPKRLKEARVSVGLSQKQLGIASGIDEFSASPRMNQYETGKHIPDYLTLRNIGKILGYPVSYFYAEDDSMAIIIKQFTKLNKNNRLKAIKLIESLVSQ